MNKMGKKEHNLSGLQNQNKIQAEPLEDLIVGAINGSTESVTQLLERDDFDVNACIVKETYTLLTHAAFNKHIDIVNILLNDPRIDVNKPETEKNRCALNIAAEENNLEAVKLLLKSSKIDVNVGSCDGRTALFCAVEKNHLKVVDELLNFKHTDVNKANNKNETPLLCACKQGFIEMVQKLLKQQKIDVNKNNLLSHICGYVQYIDKEEGWKFEVEGQGTCELEENAEQYENNLDKFLRIHEVQILQTQTLQNGAISKVFTRPTISTLCETIKLLLSHEKIEIDQIDEEGKTALMHACRYGHAKFMQLLLEKGADINFSFGSEFIYADYVCKVRNSTALIESIASPIESFEKLQVLFSRLDLKPNQISTIFSLEHEALVEGNVLIYATLEENDYKVKKLFQASSNSTYTFNMKNVWIKNGTRTEENIVKILARDTQNVSLVNELFQGYLDEKIKTPELFYFLEAYPYMSEREVFNPFIIQVVENEHLLVQRLYVEYDISAEKAYKRIWELLGGIQYLKSLIAQAKNFNIFRSIFVKIALENQWTISEQSILHYYLFFSLNFLLFLCLTISAFFVHIDAQYIDKTNENDGTVQKILWATYPMIFFMILNELVSYNYKNLRQLSLYDILKNLFQIQTIANILDWFIICVGIALPISWSSKNGSLMCLTSIYIIALFYRLILWLLLWKQVSHYLLMMILITERTLIFIIVVFFTLMFFSLGFLFIFQESEDFKTFDRQIFDLALGLLGNIELDQFYMLETPYKQTGLTLLAIFIIIIPVLAINLLIALMTSTYEEVCNQQEATYVRNKALMAVEANQYLINIEEIDREEQKNFTFKTFEKLLFDLGMVFSLCTKPQELMLDNFEKLQDSFNEQFSKLDKQLKLQDNKLIEQQKILENKLIEQDKKLEDIMDKLNQNK